MKTYFSATTTQQLRRLAALALCTFAFSFTSACADDETEPNKPNCTEGHPDALTDACTDGSGDGGDGGNGGVVDEPAEWVMHEPEGAQCADGTQYRYFIKNRPKSENLLVLYEGGGACWDYETCTAAAGSLGALGVDCVIKNLGKADADKEHCIPDDYADTYYPLPDGIGGMIDGVAGMIPKWVTLSSKGVAIDTVLPLASSGFDNKIKSPTVGENVSPMHDWNLVFMPYCTSDLYSGNLTQTYTGPDPEDPSVDRSIEFRHVGLDNSKIVAAELNEMFPNIPEFAMNGCSAGGAGVMANYHFFRSAMTGIKKGYVFADAGPFFPTDEDTTARPTHSGPLHDAVREAWGISSVFDMLINDRPDIVDTEPDHVSDLYSILSRTYPDDRFSVAHTQTDYNYSLYSYTSFHGMDHRARSSEEAKKIYEYWADDNSNLVDLLEPLENFSTYMPFWRQTNDSHCISLIGINDADPSGEELQGLLAILNDPIAKYYAGTEIEDEDGHFTYRDHAIDVLTAKTNADIPSRIGLEPNGDKMGLRKFCTPDYVTADVDGAKCQCEFAEYDKIDSDLGGEAICGCLADNLDASVEICECIIPAEAVASAADYDADYDAAYDAAIAEGKTEKAADKAGKRAAKDALKDAVAVANASCL